MRAAASLLMAGYAGPGQRHTRRSGAEAEGSAAPVCGDMGGGPERQHGLVPSVTDLESARASAGRGFQLEAGQAPRHPLARRSHRLEQFLLGLLDLRQTSVDQRDALAGALAPPIPPGLFHSSESVRV